jgi:hypothetical protein
MRRTAAWSRDTLGVVDRDDRAARAAEGDVDAVGQIDQVRAPVGQIDVDDQERPGGVGVSQGGPGQVGEELGGWS